MSYPNSGDNPYGDPGGFGAQGGGYGAQGGGFGAQGGGFGAPGPAPDNNMVWAILSTVLCCLPLGIVAIVKAANVNSLWAQGQYAAAQQASDDAKKFAMWGAIAGIVVVVLYVIFIFVIGGAASMSGY